MARETGGRGGAVRSGPVAPAPQFPENAPTTIERVLSPATPGNRGRLQYEEGIATDTSVPDDFMQGMQDGSGAPGNPDHNNPDMLYKHAAQTMGERAHLGSAAWVEAPEFTGQFASGTSEPPQNYPSVVRTGARYDRVNPAVVLD